MSEGAAAAAAAAAPPRTLPPDFDPAVGFKPRCCACAKAKKGKCGTDTATWACENRAVAGLPTAPPRRAVLFLQRRAAEGEGGDGERAAAAAAEAAAAAAAGAGAGAGAAAPPASDAPPSSGRGRATRAGAAAAAGGATTTAAATTTRPRRAAAPAAPAGPRRTGGVSGRETVPPPRPPPHHHNRAPTRRFGSGAPRGRWGDSSGVTAGHRRGQATAAGAAGAGPASPWAEEQLVALQSAYLVTVDPTAPGYWARVAACVPGKTAHECFDKLFGRAPGGGGRGRRGEEGGGEEGGEDDGGSDDDDDDDDTPAPASTRRASPGPAAMRKRARTERAAGQAVVEGWGAKGGPGLDGGASDDEDGDHPAGPAPPADREATDQCNDALKRRRGGPLRATAAGMEGRGGGSRPSGGPAPTSLADAIFSSLAEDGGADVHAVDDLEEEEEEEGEEEEDGAFLS